jgi:hypothetical protein
MRQYRRAADRRAFIILLGGAAAALVAPLLAVWLSECFPLNEIETTLPGRRSAPPVRIGIHRDSACNARDHGRRPCKVNKPSAMTSNQAHA